MATKTLVRTSKAPVATAAMSRSKSPREALTSQLLLHKLLCTSQFVFLLAFVSLARHLLSCMLHRLLGSLQRRPIRTLLHRGCGSVPGLHPVLHKAHADRGAHRPGWQRVGRGPGRAPPACPQEADHAVTYAAEERKCNQIQGTSGGGDQQ